MATVVTDIYLYMYPFIRFRGLLIVFFLCHDHCSFSEYCYDHCYPLLTIATTTAPCTPATNYHYYPLRPPPQVVVVVVVVAAA